MSWGISYKYNGYLSRCSLSNLREEIEDKRDENDMHWQKIVAMSAMSPMQVKDAEGYDIDWSDYVVNEVRKTREMIEENLRFIFVAEQILEAKAENPEGVVEG